MKKLKVGYWPLSRDLKSAGDRRRLVFWAQARGHEIITDLSRTVDVIVASEKTDLNSSILSKMSSITPAFTSTTPMSILLHK